MRRILSLVGFLLLALPAFAQSPSETTGTISAAGVDCSTATRCVSLSIGQANGTGLITVGTFTGTIAVEVSADNTTWTSPAGGTTSITTAGNYFTSLQGARWLRVRASTLGSGTPAIVLSATSAPFYGSVVVTGTTTVAGTVTANAGTNLNTSTLALETGGNLAAIKTDADKIPSQGQALAAASMPVVLPATQITTLTPLSTVTANLGTLNGAATAAGVSALEVTQGSTTSGQSGVLTQGAVTTAAPSYTTAQTAPLSLDTSGNLRVAVTGGGSNAAASATGSAVPASAGYTGVNVGGTLRGLTGLSVGSVFPATVAIVDGSGAQVTSFGGSGGTASNFGSAVPSAGTAIGASDGTNMQAPRVFDGDSGAGTQYILGTNLRKIASGGTVEAGTSSDPLRIDPTGTTTQPTNVAQINAVTPLMGNGVTGTGSQRVTIASDNTAFSVNAVQSGTWTVQPGNTANTTAWLFAGGKTHNNATPGATNIGALTMLANAAAPTFTETDLTLGSVDLHGSQRITPLDSGGTTMTDTTAHAVKVLSVDSTGANITPTTLATDDTALGTKTSITGGVMMGYAKAAAPTDVSADGDAASLWMLRNGSPVVNIAAGGSLIGATSNALDVNIKSGAGSGGTALADEAAFTQGTTSITPIGGLFKTSYTSLTSGQAGILQLTAKGGAQVSLFDTAGVTMTGTAGTAAAGVLTVQGVASMTPVQVSQATAGNLNATVVGTGTFAVQGTAAGTVAHDAVGTGVNPLLVGGYASAAAPSDVSADGDATRIWTLRNGSQVVNLAAAGALIGATSNALDVNIKSGASSGAVAQGSTTSGQTGGLTQAAVTTAAPSYTTAQTSPLSLTTAGGLRVDGSGATQPVSGTVTANIGTSGSLALDASVTGLEVSQGSTTSGQKGIVQLGAVTTAAPTYTTAQSSPISLQTDGSQRVAVTNTVTVGSHAVTNAGTFATQSAVTAASGSIASGAIASGAVASGAFASGSIGSGAIASGAIASGAVASGAFGSDSGSFGVGATGAAPPAKASFVGGLGAGATGGFVIGVPVCDSVKAVSMTSATTTLMVTGVSGRHVRICSVSLVTAIANNVAFLSGTGATCGTGTAGIAGGTTAANGYNFAANGGLTLGSGLGTVMMTAATGDSVCIVTSAAGPLAGTISYTIY